MHAKQYNLEYYIGGLRYDNRQTYKVTTHIYVYKTVKVNVNKSVNAFQLTSTGEAFIEKLCDIL